ncbi:hypothetical protein [Bradyrhizobium sp. SZCCHNS2015]|uniref:hypothetical protein n=1 Tax=Bradyrhizobium sp. SZCCHNS2015 TaxID=3057305 RepID=UPI0028F04C5D|nr:hypothetical protein [Bradyrhizobium sp. SZCCHNS2015]
MTTKRDIEKLVQWAMREELPKGRPVSASPWDLVAQVARLGVRVQTSGPVDGFGFVPGSPHEDALVISEAIDDLPGDVPFEHRADVEVLFGEWLPISGDAVDVIMRSTFDQRSLLISHAVQGTRPKWAFEQPVPYQIKTPFRDANGSLRERPRVVGFDDAGDLVDLAPNRGRKAMREGLYSLYLEPRSPLVWGDPSPIHIAECRAEYLAYHLALCSLAERLAGKLADFDPLPPAIRPLPWITGQTPVSRVLQGDLGGLAIDPDAQRLKPQRAAPMRPESLQERRRRWARQREAVDVTI